KNTNWDLIKSVSQFNPSLGVLTEIDVTFSGSVTGTIKAENLGNGPDSLTATITGNLSLLGKGVSSALSPSATSTATVAAWDGDQVDEDGNPVPSFDGDADDFTFGPTTAGGVPTTTVLHPTDSFFNQYI